MNIEDVLAAHQRIVTSASGACTCGQWPTGDHLTTWLDHLAAAIRAHLLSPEVIARAADQLQTTTGRQAAERRATEALTAATEDHQ